MTPAQVKFEMMKQTDDVKVLSRLPSTKQLSNWAYTLKRKDMPSLNTLENIITKHPDFLQKLKLYPTISILLANSHALKLLRIWGRSIYIDGTHNVCEGQLTLTTLMIKIRNYALPVCWLLSDSKTTETYASFLKSVQKLTGHMWKPERFYGDFEDALRSACKMVFPSAQYYADGFHFIQANCKYVAISSSLIV
jgi:hypothetical protein